MTTPRAKGTEDWLKNNPLGNIRLTQFYPNHETIAILAEEYPSVDIDHTITAREFFDYAENRDKPYKKLDAAYRNWVRRSFRNNWGGVTLKKKQAAPQQNQADLRAKQMNFRARNPGESDAAYQFAMDNLARENLRRLNGALK